MFTISNEEKKKLPLLGKFITCPKCGETHEIQYGKELLPDGSYIESNILAFYVCGNKTFLAGIDGKCIIKYN